MGGGGVEFAAGVGFGVGFGDEFLQAGFDVVVADADDLGLEGAVGVDGEVVREGVDAVDVRELVIGVEDLGPGHVILAGELLPGVGVLVPGDAEESEGLVCELLGEVLEFRQELPAGDAPGGPEVEEDDAAMETGERDGLAVGGDGGEGWGHGGAGEREVSEVVLGAGAIRVGGWGDLDVAGEGLAGVRIAAEGGEGAAVEEERGAEVGVVCDGGFEGGVGLGEFARGGLVAVEVEGSAAVEEIGVGLVFGLGGEALELDGGGDGLLPGTGAEAEGGDPLEALGAGVAGEVGGPLPVGDLGGGIGGGASGVDLPLGGEIGVEGSGRLRVGGGCGQGEEEEDDDVGGLAAAGDLAAPGDLGTAGDLAADDVRAAGLAGFAGV